MSDLLLVTCGSCGGQMRVDRSGEAVVCPHCEAHLRVPPKVEAGARLQVESGSGVLDRVSSRSGVLKSGESSARSGIHADAVSKKLFVLVASYASAVTIACLVLLFGGNSHQLESLPDVRPLNDGEIQFVGFDARLPDGHTLALGESRRFGDVRITPLKVTREPIEFAHYRDKGAERDPTDPVLKLWMKFENLASDVAFPPWDVSLMTRRVPLESDPLLYRTNTFLVPAKSAPRTPEKIILNFEHPVGSDWNLKGMRTEPLQPGEAYTTFVASSEEGLQRATDDARRLVWRLQVRKGIHRETRHGVTTLVDVVFSTSDIGI